MEINCEIGRKLCVYNAVHEDRNPYISFPFHLCNFSNMTINYNCNITVKFETAQYLSGYIKF